MTFPIEKPPSLAPMPNSSAHNNPFSTAGDIKFNLQNILVAKEKQLQQADTLQLRVLAQQMELDERIRRLQDIEADKGEDDEIDPGTRDRYRELADIVLVWDAENAQLSSSFGGSSNRYGNVNMPSPSMLYTDLPREELERLKASATSSAQLRRAKNAVHRADDAEFAFEVGSGLLAGVQRLQSLLEERDKMFQDMKEEKDDLEKMVENLRAALKQQEQSTDKFKDENWNLRTQLDDFRASTQRLESEHRHLTTALAVSRDAANQHMNEGERLQRVIEDMKAKHETDVAQARRHAASLARDKSDLQQTIDQLKTEATRAARRLPRFGSPVTPNGPSSDDFHTPANGEDGGSDIFGTTGGASTSMRKMDKSGLFPRDKLTMDDYLDSPEQSLLQTPSLALNHPKNEIEALQQRHAHAQITIHNTNHGVLSGSSHFKIQNSKFTDNTYNGPVSQVTAGGAAVVASVGAVAGVSVAGSAVLYNELRSARSDVETARREKSQPLSRESNDEMTSTTYSCSSRVDLSSVLSEQLQVGAGASTNTSGHGNEFISRFGLRNIPNAPPMESTCALLLCASKSKLPSINRKIKRKFEESL